MSLARQEGSKDNITCIVVFLKEPSLIKEEPPQYVLRNLPTPVGMDAATHDALDALRDSPKDCTTLASDP